MNEQENKDLLHRISGLEDKIKHWREKHFNDVMSAKKSGWDDCLKFYEQKRLDRPDREKIAITFEKNCTHCASLRLSPCHLGSDVPCGRAGFKEICVYQNYRADQLLALVIPDIEEAKKQEGERIQREFEGEWYSVADLYCPAWIIRFRDILYGVKLSDALKETEGGKE